MIYFFSYLSCIQPYISLGFLLYLIHSIQYRKIIRRIYISLHIYQVPLHYTTVVGYLGRYMTSIFLMQIFGEGRARGVENLIGLPGVSYVSQSMIREGSVLVLSENLVELSKPDVF